MNSKIPIVLGYSRVTKKGKKNNDILRWGIYGWHSLPLDCEDEPLRTFSYHGWRGSKRHPFGQPFKDPF